MKRTISLGLLVISLSSGAACGPLATASDGGDGGASDGGTRALTGTFRLQLVAPSGTTPGSTTLAGRVLDGETPSQVQWVQTAVDGDCKLVTPRIPSCTPACGSSAACVADNTCQRYPTAQSAGAARITGLRSGAAIELTAVSNTYQLPGGVTLAFPPFAEGDSVTVTADGAGSVPAFTLSARAIAPLAITSTMIQIAANAPVNLAWTPPASGASQRIRVKLDISHHGGSRGMITCDTEDDGALTIAAPLVTSLVALGVAGFPSIVVARESVGTSAVVGGSVNLAIVSELEQYVTIPGVRSCTEDADCMGNGTCRPDLTCGS